MARPWALSNRAERLRCCAMICFNSSNSLKANLLLYFSLSTRSSTTFLFSER